MTPKYVYSKKIMIPTLILIILLFAYVINIEGWSIFLLSQDIVCPNQTEMGVNKCETLFLGNGTKIQLLIGQTYHLNPHNHKNIDLLNYGAVLIMLTGYLLNALIYNKGYPYKQRLNEMIEYWNKKLEQKK
jgi:hypothetical protein